MKLVPTKIFFYTWNFAKISIKIYTKETNEKAKRMARDYPSFGIMPMLSHVFTMYKTRKDTHFTKNQAHLFRKRYDRSLTFNMLKN